MNLIRKPEWNISENLATSEGAYQNRKKFLRNLGIVAASVSGLPLCSQRKPPPRTAKDVFTWNKNFLPEKFPAKRNPAFPSVPKRDITPERLAATYNNYYEFTTRKEAVWETVGGFRTDPWTVEIGGLVRKPGRFDLDDLARRFAFEERVCRFRCVEAWSMVVPWTGFRLADLVKFADPLPQAKFVRFVSFLRPEEAPGQTMGPYKWPYYEGLRLDEATNELALLTTGMYGHPLNVQNGAPLRLILPWKYGYKSAKGIVRIEFVKDMPPTFWNDAAPDEYGFYSNVNPAVPHPRWSQAHERPIDGSGRIPTLPFNGYEKFVGHMYDRETGLHAGFR